MEMNIQDLSKARNILSNTISGLVWKQQSHFSVLVWLLAINKLTLIVTNFSILFSLYYLILSLKLFQPVCSLNFRVEEKLGDFPLYITSYGTVKVRLTCFQSWA